MALGASGKPLKYKIKLSSGRILGPLDLERVRLLILKKHVDGSEVARVYPEGEWVGIYDIPELAELLFKQAQGVLEQDGAIKKEISSTVVLPEGQERAKLRDAQGDPRDANDDEKTLMVSLGENGSDPDNSEGEKTRIGDIEFPGLEQREARDLEIKNLEPGSGNFLSTLPSDKKVSQEPTVMIERSALKEETQKKKPKGVREILRVIVVGLLLGGLGYEFFLEEPEQKTVVRLKPIRPMLPDFVQGSSDPKQSIQIYGEAMKSYVADTVLGYRIAADKLRKSAAFDINNVKALAMLASSYINLIDSSNKDENYFTVLSKLTDMSRAKAIDLPETVIADVEFFLTVNKAEAAQNRIIEFTKLHQNYGIEMFYYLALTFLARGDAVSAAQYIANYPEDKAFSAKLFYLKGQIAEKLKDPSAAMLEYKKAIKMNPSHAKSHLRIAALFQAQGMLKEATPYLEFLVKNTALLDPLDLGLAYYLHGLLSELQKKMDIALNDIERAAKLDPENHDYILELYTLRAKAGESVATLQKQGRMYYFLGEAEKLIQLGRHQDALVPLLQARTANEGSPVPLVKIGDMFSYLHDVENAKINYKLAADKAPNNIQVWSKYIAVLIQSYEWEEATKAMDRFRKLPVSQSAIDKAAADLYQRQSRFKEAQTFYRKAMGRDSIDPDVYVAYAKSLMATKNFKDAPFFFALAQRFDPLNVDTVINIAKCVAETESIDRAISTLYDELKKGDTTRAEYLAAIAEFQIQKGEWEKAQESISQAMKVNPDYAYPWKLQAQIYMNKESVDKNALDNALFAYKSYSERNASDPSGYLERYKIFARKAEFEKAKDELAKIYSIYPKYPNLHFYLGALYSVQGNHKVAAEEFKRELLNNPDSVPALINYGKELTEEGNLAEALNVLTKAMRIAPLSADAKQNAAWVNFKLKNYQAAIALFMNGIKLDPGNPTIYKRLGLTYREMGDMGAACGAFRKYLEMEPDASDKAEYQACL